MTVTIEVGYISFVLSGISLSESSSHSLYRGSQIIEAEKLRTLSRSLTLLEDYPVNLNVFERS